MAKVSLRAYNREIETMIDRGQLDEAIAHCHHILKAFPKHLETYRLLGKAYLEAKRYGDAVDIFSRVLASVPNDFVSQVGMSIIRDEENKLDDAIWHMERAFETQPSNSAIQSELQRLYGRRDGVQPPRIRMTRGALANMYVQGELYPQAISEIKSVLKDDPGRSDMQALLARANFKSGAKNDAVDAALALLQRNPYSLDANRVLVEVLSADRNENVQAYRQRLVELDPYASQVTGSVFLSNEVPDAAVSIERLDWNGQPMGMQPDWRENQAISLESGTSRTEQPDWLKGSFGDVTPPPPSQPTGASMFETPVSSPATPAQPADEIPDFLKAAGWGESTGTFDESKSIFSDEAPAVPAQSIEQGDLPDWVKAMKPAEPEPESPAQQEELPDWINKIGTGALSASAGEQQSAQSDQPDWLKGFGEPQEQVQSGDDQPDWLKGLGTEPERTATEQPDESDWMKSLETPSDVAPQSAETETPDWLKGLGTETEPAAAQQPDESDWMKSLETPSDLTPQPAQTETPDWLKDLENEPAPAATEETDQSDWLKQFNAEADSVAAPASGTSDFDFLNELTEEPILQNTQESTPSLQNMGDLGKSEQEQDDSFAWLENLAAKQGATEGLLTKPEERLEEEPEWVKQAKGLTSEPSVPQTPANLEDLGKSEQERDDSFAWLENLAANQGANEGLLTKPEDRLQEEPEWVKQAKGLTSETAVSPPPANVEELGKSEQERDDSFAWLEGLAAKQGASEGLLTKPEERLEQEPEWVRQAKDLGAQQPATPTSQPEPSVEQPPSMDDTAAWLRSLEEEKPSEPVSGVDETAMWLKGLDEAESSKVQPAESMDVDMPAWMKNLEEEETPVATESTISAEETQPASEWIQATEESVSVPESKSEESGLPSWLSELEKEEQVAVPSSDDDLPAWLRSDDVITEKPEPTHATDWKPVEGKQAEEPKQPEFTYSPAPEEKYPEIIYSPALEEETKQPEPEIVKEPVHFEERREVTLEQPVEPQREETKPEPRVISTHAAEPYREPVTRRVPGVAIPGADPVLGAARNELSRNNIPGALESYGRLIKKARFLDEVIHDLRDALYRYPVEVNLWQSLGDAYMRANRLQDALDAYTKAEELLR